MLYNLSHDAVVCRNAGGLYIRGLVEVGEAHLDGRLRPGDQVLSINGVDQQDGTQDSAAALIAVSLTVGDVIVTGDVLFQW